MCLRPFSRVELTPSLLQSQSTPYPIRKVHKRQSLQLHFAHFWINSPVAK
uniref:Uncharacterized protein n=1 Tax=Anopheles gambiae TaxID=7165 RepID=A0A903XXM4_ANOGA